MSDKHHLPYLISAYFKTFEREKLYAEFIRACGGDPTERAYPESLALMDILNHLLIKPIIDGFETPGRHSRDDFFAMLNDRNGVSGTRVPYQHL